MSVAADEPDAVALLVGEHPVAVDLLLLDPAVAVEGLREQRRDHHRGVLRDHGK